MSLPTAEQVLALATDASAAKAGQSQASLRHWSGLGRDARALWGLCQGSGKQPYQVRVALPELTSGCTCPSRKFPCKHALGLMLLAAHGNVAEGAAPDYIEEWLGRREARAATVAAKRDAASADADPARAERTAARRDRRIDDGVAELAAWIEDLVLTGFAHAPVRDPAFWETRARRLVDAQAPGLARRLGALHGVVLRHADWPARVLGELGSIYLACEACARRDGVDAAARADLMRCLGQAQQKDDVDAANATPERWTGLGQFTESVDKVQMQRSWLRRASDGRIALVLGFAAGNAPLPAVLAPGRQATLRLGFYPGTLAQRAAVLEPARDVEPARTPPGGDVAALLDAQADALAADPWVERIAGLLRARLARDAAGRWWLVDAHGDALPLRDGADGWPAYAATAGAPATWTVEWNGAVLDVLRTWPQEVAA